MCGVPVEGPAPPRHPIRRSRPTPLWAGGRLVRTSPWRWCASLRAGRSPPVLKPCEGQVAGPAGAAGTVPAVRVGRMAGEWAVGRGRGRRSSRRRGCGLRDGPEPEEERRGGPRREQGRRQARAVDRDRYGRLRDVTSTAVAHLGDPNLGLKTSLGDLGEGRIHEVRHSPRANAALWRKQAQSRRRNRPQDSSARRHPDQHHAAVAAADPRHLTVYVKGLPQEGGKPRCKAVAKARTVQGRPANCRGGDLQMATSSGRGPRLQDEIALVAWPGRASRRGHELVRPPVELCAFTRAAPGAMMPGPPPARLSPGPALFVAVVTVPPPRREERWWRWRKAPRILSHGPGGAGATTSGTWWSNTSCRAPYARRPTRSLGSGISRDAGRGGPRVVGRRALVTAV